MSDINTQALADYQRLENILRTARGALDKKEEELAQLESKTRQGILPYDNVHNLKKNLEQLPYFLQPGNVGQINEVIWPFYYATGDNNSSTVIVNPNQSLRSSFSVTQEAAFVMMSYTKTVYVVDGDDITYIDPDANGVGDAPGLKYLIRDAQSSREFFNLPLNIDQVGNPRWPTILPSPQMFIPNAIVEVDFINSHPTNVYAVQMQFFGYRIRLEKAKDILSLVYG
jgi:hypothetical protein